VTKVCDALIAKGHSRAAGWHVTSNNDFVCYTPQRICRVIGSWIEVALRRLSEMIGAGNP